MATATSGAEALNIIRGTPVDLLFTDVVMPGDTGPDVGAMAQHMRPGLKVLFTSGYLEGSLIGRGTLPRGTHFLVKPYRRKQLEEKIREVLSSKV